MWPEDVFLLFSKRQKKDTRNREVEIFHTFITFFSPAPERARSGDFANSAECKQKHENEECNWWNEYRRWQ